jgi:hypothetical protein
MHYYTYAYLREDKTPYYIGKGKGDRINSKKRSIKPPKDKSRIIYLKQNLTEAEAFKHEIYMIDVFGRIDLGTGILHNMTNGGDGVSGAIISDETKRKLSEAHKGKTHSEETRRKISEAKKGKTHSEETKRKIGEAHKNPSEETRRKIGEASKGRNKDRIVSEETRRKMSESGKGRTHSEDSKKKMSEASKGTKWWNDGCGNCKMMIECPGDGWKPGRK